MEPVGTSVSPPYGRIEDPQSRDRVAIALIVLVLVLLPLERWVLPHSLRVADLALVLLTAYGIGEAWRTRRRLEFPLLLPMWLILLSSLVATLLGFSQLDSTTATVQEVYLFVWFIFLANVVRTLSPSDQDLLFRVWSVIACAEAATTLMGMLRIGPRMFYTSFFYADPLRERAIVTAGLSRAVGTFINPNATAAYLSVSFFALLATRWPTWLRSVLGVWLLLGMFGTGSLGALVSTGAGLVVLMLLDSVLRSRQSATLSWAVLGVGAGVLGALLLVLGLWPSLLPKIGFGTSGRLFALTVGRLPRSVGARLHILERAVPVYARHPWGTGPNSFGALHLSLHNDYVAFLFERGPLGLIGWLWIVVATLLMPLNAALQCADGRQRWSLLALGAGFLAAALNALSHEVSHFRQVWVLMAFLYGVSHSRSTRSALSFSAGTGWMDTESV